MKRLALFLDGTWNTLNNNTNVWRMKSLCDETDSQRVYYGQGVGTRRGEIARGGITGYGIDNEIIDAYTWLIENFSAGDEIFIFGFSRGAYTARSLSGLISKCGVLKLGAPLSIEQLYDRYRLYSAPTIRSLLAHGLPKDASLEDQWLVKYTATPDIKFIGVWDTVGSLGLPIGSAEAKVHRFRFLDTHLRLSNLNAFHALALDEHRRDFEPTFWTKTVRHAEAGPPDRPIDKVEQRWFVGAHANVGGGYPSDALAQLPLKWLMGKAAAAGLVFSAQIELDTTLSTPPITDSYRDFAHGLYRFISRPFYRPVALPPKNGTGAITTRINETIDGSVFDRWRMDQAYRPPNIVEWGKRMSVDPAKLHDAIMANDPKIKVP